MKRLILISIAILFLATSNSSYAQTEENSKNNNEPISELSDKVDLIKNKVASRVAELKLVEKRGIVGVVESVSNNEIKINDLNNKTRIIEVDELTKYTSTNGNFDITDIEKGANISAIGLYNKDSGKLLARFVNEISIPIFLNGVISDKDKDEFTLTLNTEESKDYIVDVENITKTYSFNNGDLDSIGFAKIDTLKNALIIGYINPKDDNKITASKIIIFPDVTKNPRIEIDTANITPEVSKSPSPSSNKNDN